MLKILTEALAVKGSSHLFKCDLAVLNGCQCDQMTSDRPGAVDINKFRAAWLHFTEIKDSDWLK